MAVTTRLRLNKPAAGTRQWNTIVDANLDALDAQNPIGAFAVALAESPSASRNVRVAAGSFRKSDGTLVAYAGTSSFTCSSSSTCRLYLDDSGTLSQSTTGWPASKHLPLATVVAGASTITSVTDERVPFAVIGPPPAHADQGALAAQGQQALTDSSGGTASTTLAAISDTATKNAVASLAARLAEVKTDVANVRTLLARLRTDLVNQGVIKGSA